MINISYYKRGRFSAFILVLALVLIFSCSDNDTTTEEMGTLQISAQSTLSNSSSRIASSDLSNELSITDVWVNLSEFEIELDHDEDSQDIDDEENEDEDDSDQGGDDLDDEDEENEDGDEDWDDDGEYDYEDEIELEGPFELNLMEGQVTFVNISMPIGVFEELEFEFTPSMNPTSIMFGKSILIQGTINENPFIFWHDASEEVEVDFEDSDVDILVSTTPEGVIINFDLSFLFDSINGIDLSSAMDSNNDGVIEIGPTDTDGNNFLAEQIWMALKNQINLMDD